MEREERANRCESPPPADRRRHPGRQHCSEEPMKKDVVVRAEPARLGTAENAVADIDQSAEAVRIGRRARPAMAARSRGDVVTLLPSSQPMSR